MKRVCNGFTNRCQAKVHGGLPHKAPLTAQKVQHRAHQLRARASRSLWTAEGLQDSKQPPATSDSPSNNIVPLGHSQEAESAQRDGTDKLSQDKTVPENVASARAWIAAWRAKNQASGAAYVTEVQALRREVEKLKGLLSAAEAAAGEAEAELSRTSANRDILAFSLARQVFEAATLRKQCDDMQAALDHEKEHVQVLISQQQSCEVKAASAGQQAAPSSQQLPGPAAVPQPAPPGGFTNTNRFWVPNHLEPKFLRAVAERQAAMQQAPGFLGLSVREFTNPNQPVEEFVLEVSSSWATAPDWEAWSGGRESLRHPLPSGVMQYPPKKGEGFPEDYVPFKDLAAEVPNAKY